MLRLFKRALTQNARAGLFVDESRIGLAHIQRADDGSLSLASCAFRIDEDEQWSDRAASRIGGTALRRAAVSAVLRPDAYQMQLVETPNVPAEEMSAAVRWRIKDFIDYPAAEAVIEVFEMPLHANPGTKPTAYAVVSHRSEILHQIEFVANAGLQMDVIDIPELCMRNIAALLPQDQDGVAFLHLTENCGYLTITRQRVLHLIRRIETGRRALAEVADDEFTLQERVAGISLEVQRSLDYYESHFDCQPIRELVVGPGAGLDMLPAALTQTLGLNVSRVEIGKLCNMENDISPEEEGNCLLAVGAALRMHEAAAVSP